MEEREMKLNTLHTIALWLTVAVSALTLGLVVWKGGMLAERVDTHDRRLQLLETQGSRGLSAHETMDDTRVKALEERLRKLEEAVLTFAQMKYDVAEIKTSLEFLTGKRTIPKTN